jgi:hypothetical protein
VLFYILRPLPLRGLANQPRQNAWLSAGYFGE